MTDLEKVDWRGIVISAIENPQNQTANFEELREKATKENKGFGKKIVFENKKYQLIFKICWDKDKFFFQYNSVVVNKQSNEKNKRISGVDETHGYRHLHSGEFVTRIPTILIEKLEHPILSLIVNSEIETRKREWIRILTNELKESMMNWKESPYMKKLKSHNALPRRAIFR